MRWSWWRREPAITEDLDEAHAQADRAITDARQLRSRANQVAGEMMETRRRNHFADSVSRRFRGAL